jgi:hypothetical protein
MKKQYVLYSVEGEFSKYYLDQIHDSIVWVWHSIKKTLKNSSDLFALVPFSYRCRYFFVLLTVWYTLMDGDGETMHWRFYLHGTTQTDRKTDRQTQTYRIYTFIALDFLDHGQRIQDYNCDPHVQCNYFHNVPAIISNNLGWHDGSTEVAWP